jgi:hypothetical protein
LAVALAETIANTKRFGKIEPSESCSARARTGVSAHTRTALRQSRGFES